MSRSRISLLLISLLGAGAVGCAPSPSGSSAAEKLCMSRDEAQAQLQQSQLAPASVAGDSSRIAYIVKMKDNSAGPLRLRDELERLLGSTGLVTFDRINDDLVQLTLPHVAASLEILQRYIASDDIEFIEPDYEVHHEAAFSASAFDKQWAHAKVQSAGAWAHTKGSADILVGVIDSGVDINHPDLKANVWKNTREIPGNGIDDDRNGYVDDVHGWNFANNNNNPVADDKKSYHGTHVAGTIAAVQNERNSSSGHAPGVKIMALKYLNSSGVGVTSNAIKAIDYAIGKGVKILSNSWGSFNSSSALQNAIQRAAQAGILFVAAAGNGDSQGRGVNLDLKAFYPASYPVENVLAVAATNSADKLAAWSNFGATRVDLAAPGVSIYSTRNNGTYAYLSGTSMATPLVSAVAALVWSVRPDFTYKDVKRALMASVDKVSSLSGKVVTGGRINAAKAVAYARSYTKVPSSDESTFPTEPTEPSLCRP